MECGGLLRVPKSISNLILHWNGLFLPGFGNVGLLELRCRQAIEAQKSALVSLAKGPKSITTGIPMCDFPIFHHVPRILQLQTRTVLFTKSLEVFSVSVGLEAMDVYIQCVYVYISIYIYIYIYTYLYLNDLFF